MIKTRDKLIEVARRLFAHQGVEKTTMNDIAEASDRGRRTIYTYFKSKDEIYDAIIEKESDALLARLHQVVELEIEPIVKLERYLRVRFDFLESVVPAKDYLTLLFSPDARRWRRIRKLALQKEHALFQRIIDQGVESGDFDAAQANRLPAIESLIVHTIKIFRDPYHAQEFGLDIPDSRDKLIDFIIHGVVRSTPAVPLQTT